MSRRTFWIIFAAGCILRLLFIWQAELWYDENFSLVLSRLPFLSMLAATLGDVHPPLYYILIWPLGQIHGLPPWALRIPSALFSMLSLALFPRVMRGLRIQPRVQLIAFAFLAFLPMQIHYAQEARMYALLELLVILAVLALLEGRSLLLGFSVAGLLYTQNYGTFYVAALVLVYAAVVHLQAERHREAMMDLHASMRDIGGLKAMQLVDPIDERLRSDLWNCWARLGRAILIGILVWLPWVPVMWRQASFISDSYWLFDTSIGGLSYEIFKLFWSLSLSSPLGNVTGMLLAFSLILLAIWYLLVKRPPAWFIIAALAFGPICAAILVSLVWQPLFLFRPLIGVTPFLYLACACPLGAISSLRGRLYAACFVLPVLVLGLGGYYIYNPQQKTTQGTGSMRQAVEYITAHWRSGDVILHGSGLGWVSIAPYTNLPQYAIPNCTPKFPGSISPTTRDAIGIPAGDIAHLPPHERIWFTAVLSPMLPPCQQKITDSITHGHEPVLVLSKTKFLYSAVWLLEE
jgi:uncharacterized membrane protein